MDGTKKRPLIGVTTSYRGGITSWLFNCLAVWRAGGRALWITHRTRKIDPEMAGLIIGGGDDIDARLYGGEFELNIRVDKKRDALEKKLLEEALEQGIPVLGICRGAQIINVHLKGSLYTDIYKIYEEAPRMRTVLPRKNISIKPDSRLFEIIRRQRYRINCLHHQSIDRLGEGLNVVARDDYDIIQAVECEAHPFLIGVQWHPEYLPLNLSHQRLFHALVQKADDEV